MCKKVGAGVVHVIQTMPPYPTNTPMGRASQIQQSSAIPLALLALADQLAWIDERRTQLVKKQARERAYLDRRAARGAHTPTDDAYEADAILESELLEALDLLHTVLQGGPSPSLSSGSNTTYAGDTSMLFPLPGPHDKLLPS